MRFTTPTLAELEAYDGVLVWNDHPFADSSTLGNNLADYVDAGHGVVLATFANAAFDPLGGRWATGGYDAIDPGGWNSGFLLTLGTVDQPSHPIMAGVNSFSGGFASWHGTGGLTAGSSLIASWSNGQPLVVEKSSTNVCLNFFPPSSDAYSDGWDSTTQGALLMANALDYVSGFGVSTTVPANNSLVSATPTEYVVNVTEAVAPASLNASDFRVNGIPADDVSYTPGTTTVTFTFDSDPVTAQGLQTMHVAAGAFDRVSDGTGVREFNGTFRYDAVLMQVTSTAPAVGSTVTLPATTLDLNFNEPYALSSAQAGDFTVNQGSVSGVSRVDADTLRLTLSGVIAEGTLTVSMAAGAMADVYGNPGAAFSGSYTLDFGTFPFPVPLNPIAPAGSLIYDGVQSGGIGFPGDADGFTLNLDPGQKLTLVVTPGSAPLYGGVGNGSFNAGAFLRVDPATGAGALLADPVTPGGLSGLAFDPSAGVVYGSTIRNVGNVSTLVRIDPATGALLSTVGTITDGPGGPGISIGDLALQPGTNTLFGIGSNAGGFGGRLYTIDKATGVATFVGATGSGSGGGIAFAPDGSLYQTAHNSGFDFPSLNRLDPATAARLSTVPVPGYFDGLAVRPSDGVIFAAPGGLGDQIYTIDPATGAATFVGGTGTGSPSDLAFGVALAPTVELRDQAGNLLGTGTAAPGYETVLQTVATHGQLGQAGPGPKTYTATVRGAGGTTGGYTLRAVMNAAVEGESHGGTANDTRAMAQSLEPAFLPFNGSVTSNQSAPYPGRAAVLGRHDDFAVSTVFIADFESGLQGFTIDNTPPDDFHVEGLWHLSAGRGSQPGHSASQSLYYGTGEGPDGGGSINIGFQVTPTAGTMTSPAIALPAGGVLQLDFNYVLQTRVFPDFVDFADLLIDNGSGWSSLRRFDRVAESSAWRASDPVDLTAYAGQTVRLRWSFDTVQGPVGRFPEGWYVDDVRVRQFVPVADYYSLALRAGESATLALKNLSAGGLTLALEDAAGATVATGVTTAANVESVIGDFVAPSSGTYYARVRGTNVAGTDYSLVVTRNAGFDTEGNDGIASAQPILATPVAGRQWALGATQSGTIDHSGGFATNGDLAANGSASFTGGVARLTDGGVSQAGSIFSRDAVSVTSFDTEFTFRLLPATFPPADGITFTIQGVGSAALGAAGSGLGYEGIPSSVAVKFDNWDNENGGFPDSETGLYTGGESPGQPSIDLLASGVDLTTDHPFHVAMSYDGAVLSVTITDTVTLASASQSYAVDIPAAVGGGVAYVGFTGATGGLSAVQDVLGWSFRSQPQSDFYRVVLAGGQPLEAETATPGGGSGVFVNLLDPAIRVYNSAGALVASDDNSADGRNARVKYNVPKGQGGVYYIEVTSSAATPAPTAGEYVLSVKGNVPGGPQGAGGSSRSWAAFADPTPSAHSAPASSAAWTRSASANDVSYLSTARTRAAAVTSASADRGAIVAPEPVLATVLELAWSQEVVPATVGPAAGPLWAADPLPADAGLFGPAVDGDVAVPVTPAVFLPPSDSAPARQEEAWPAFLPPAGADPAPQPGGPASPGGAGPSEQAAVATTSEGSGMTAAVGTAPVGAPGPEDFNP